MSVLADQTERDRFVHGHGLNLSVIAPAGVGKTTSIVERIVRLAQLPEAQAVDALPRLVVVTYSVRAAQQMQQRARVALRAAAVPRTVRRAFQQTFFGTIHSYCVRLLDRFGHYIGLPSPIGLLEQDDELWQRFLRRGMDADMAAEGTADLFHFIGAEQLYGLGRTMAPGDEMAVSPLPQMNFGLVLAFDDPQLHGNTRSAIRRSQQGLLAWQTAWQRGEHHHPLPAVVDSAAAAAFRALWLEAFAPLHTWICDTALGFGRKVARAYEAFRLGEAMMTYDDQVRLALRVLENPDAQREMAEDRVSVLLDEAQDTDRRQFEVLRRVAGLAAGADQPADQTFSIVGDFQQAIYAPRSDLTTYRRVHEEIVRGPRGASSRLQVTFRCDAAILDFVNRVFPSVLDGRDGQSHFEPLQPRAGAGPGRVARWVCPNDVADNPDEPQTSAAREEAETHFIARRLKELGQEGLGVEDWSDVAILCPRRRWLASIESALRAQGVPVQLHSSNEQRRDRTAGAWLAALIWVAAHPEDSFEIAGVLREIFGVADSDMAHFTNRDGDKLRLDRPIFSGGANVEQPLAALRDACAGAQSLPLAEFITRLVAKTQLRERLTVIRRPAAPGELDAVMEALAVRAAEGITLADLATELRSGLTSAPPAEEEIDDAVQLMTSHKSKGLEWPVVIVPFVFRRIEELQKPYPRVLPGLDGEEMLCRDKADFDARARDVISRRDRQQYQRLFYVVATRAKRSLIWIDDEALYAGRIGRPGNIPGEILGFAGGNREAWLSLGDPPAPALDPAQAARNRAADAEAPGAMIEAVDLQLAQARARDFPRRVTPHALAVHLRTEAEPERTLELEDDARPAGGPGVLYGTWWHEMVQSVPWTAPKEAWQEAFLRARPSTPDAGRAQREWKLFLQSKLAEKLGRPGKHLLPELPFLWRGEDGQILEGVMDLAWRESGDSTWRVIDWKTNRVTKSGAGPIVEIYRGQISAYVQALQHILGATVKGSLYVTRTGEWCDVT